MSDDWGNDPIQGGAAAAPAAGTSDWGNDPVAGAKNYKFSDKAITDAQKRPGTVTIYMHPDAYLALTPELETNPKTDKKGVSLKKSLDKGDDVNEVPSLDVTVGKDGTAKVVDQDGRHRAQFAKDAGVDLIPVAVQRSGEKGLIKQLSGMRDDSKPVPFDFKPVLPPIKKQEAPAAPPAAKGAPRWDVVGDIGRAAKSGSEATRGDLEKAFPDPNTLMAQSAENRKGYGVIGGAVKDSVVDPVRRMGNALKVPVDAVATALSPVTGTVHALGGSAIAAGLDKVPIPGHDPKVDADNLLDQAGMFVGPEGVASAAAKSIAAGNALKRVANLKPGAAEAHAAGYVLPPTMALEKPGVGNSLASGVGGKIKLQQGSSVRNQEVTNRLAAEALGLPGDTVLTDKKFNDVRKTASNAYKAVANSIPEITVDPIYQQNIANLGGRNSAANAQFPGVMKNDELDTFIKNVGSVQKFSPDAGLEVVRKLRKDAVSNLKAMGDPNKTALGLAQRSAADEIDELIERNLVAAGKSGLVSDYKAARQLLAKSHDVQGATNTATGDVSARGLGRLAAKGKPLTGQLKVIADTANAFPKAMQNTAAFGSDEPYSALDIGATAFAAAHGDYGAVGTILARPVMRNALLSNMMQDRMIPNAAALAALPPPQSGMALVHNAPLPGVQNQLALGIFRAAHVNGLRALTMPQPYPPQAQGQ